MQFDIFCCYFYQCQGECKHDSIVVKTEIKIRRCNHDIKCSYNLISSYFIDLFLIKYVMHFLKPRVNCYYTSKLCVLFNYCYLNNEPKYCIIHLVKLLCFLYSLTIIIVGDDKMLIIIVRL